MNCRLPRRDALRRPKANIATERPSSRISFFSFGVEHILTGYDHLLFLSRVAVGLYDVSRGRHDHYVFHDCSFDHFGDGSIGRGTASFRKSLNR